MQGALIKILKGCQQNQFFLFVTESVFGNDAFYSSRTKPVFSSLTVIIEFLRLKCVSINQIFCLLSHVEMLMRKRENTGLIFGQLNTSFNTSISTFNAIKYVLTHSDKKSFIFFYNTLYHPVKFFSKYFIVLCYLHKFIKKLY